MKNAYFNYWGMKELGAYPRMQGCPLITVSNIPKQFPMH